MLKQVIPILAVDRIEASLPFWVDRLGFTPKNEALHGDALGFVMLVRDDLVVELQTRASIAVDIPALAPVAGIATLYFPVEDLAPIERALAGYDDVVGRRDAVYGMRELIVREPSGHFVTFGTPLSQAR
jgi:catechol 2,3-dioxygenase-like lactoylglutathione lyase family enzyme